MSGKNFIISILSLIICLLVIIAMIMHRKHIAELNAYKEFYEPQITKWKDQYNREHVKTLGLSKQDTIYRDVIKHVKDKPDAVVYVKEKTALDTMVKKKKRYSLC